MALASIVSQAHLDGRCPAAMPLRILTETLAIDSTSILNHHDRESPISYSGLHTSAVFDYLSSFSQSPEKAAMIMAVGNETNAENSFAQLWDHALTRMGFGAPQSMSEEFPDGSGLNNFSQGIVISFGNSQFRVIGRGTKPHKSSAKTPNAQRGFVLGALLFEKAAEELLHPIAASEYKLQSPHSIVDSMQQIASFIANLIKDSERPASEIWVTGMGARSFGYLRKTLDRALSASEMPRFLIPDLTQGHHAVGTMLQFLEKGKRHSLLLDFLGTPLVKVFSK